MSLDTLIARLQSDLTDVLLAQEDIAGGRARIIELETRIAELEASAPVPEPPPPALDYLPVIAGAAGYGMHTRAAYGDVVPPSVIKVTNLNASGAGSLRAGLEASGPRVVVFEVSGNIDLGWTKIEVNNPYLTVAGQTAPAPGISVIKGGVTVATHEVLIQHIRFRGGRPPTPKRILPLDVDNYQGSAYNVVIDHVSMAWSTDDLMQTWFGAHGVTWSHVLATGELRDPGFYSDMDGKVAITSSSDYSILIRDTALITGYQRMPLARSNPFVFVNNVVYNWGGNASDLQRSGVSSGGEFVFDNNHYRTGPLYGQAWMNRPILWKRDPVPGMHLYINGNYAEGLNYTVNQQWDLVSNQTGYTQAQLQVLTPGAWPQGLIAKSAAGGAIFNTVLDNAGAFPKNRDSLDTRLVNDARNRTGGFVTTTVFPTVAQNYRALSLPANPNNDDDNDGYTNLEEWLHCMAAQVEGRSCQ